MSYIDSKKDNSKKIADYGKNLGISILKFCILILIGCLILYASKACGAGILDAIIPTYYIQGLTNSLLKPEFDCDETVEDDNYLGKEFKVDSTLEYDIPVLKPQIINQVKVGDDIMCQRISFVSQSKLSDPYSSINSDLIKARQESDKKITSSSIGFKLFQSAISSDVALFNISFLNSYFKLLNKHLSDSVIILFAPLITMMVLLIISIMSIFVTVYSIIINYPWLIYNYTDSFTSSRVASADIVSHTFSRDLSKPVYVKGSPIFCINSSDLKFTSWIWWLGLSVMKGYAVGIASLPVSIGCSAYNILRWLFYIIGYNSTYYNDTACNFLSMFTDTFKYKRYLISLIMSLIIISSSFDAFDNAGGITAIVVFALVFFNFIKVGLFDKTDLSNEASDAFESYKDFQQLQKSKEYLDTFGNFCTTKYTNINFKEDLEEEDAAATAAENDDAGSGDDVAGSGDDDVKDATGEAAKDVAARAITNADADAAITTTTTDRDAATAVATAAAKKTEDAAKEAAASAITTAATLARVTPTGRIATTFADAVVPDATIPFSQEEKAGKEGKAGK